MNKKKQSEPKNEPPPVPKIDPKSNPKRNRTGRDSQDGGCFGFFFCLVLRVWFVVCTSGATPISHGTRRRVPRERHQSTETRNGVEKTGNKKKQSIERASFFFVFFLQRRVSGGNGRRQVGRIVGRFRVQKVDAVAFAAALARRQTARRIFQQDATCADEQIVLDRSFL